MISKDVIDSVENLRCETTENIELIQSALIPSYLDMMWREVPSYTIGSVQKPLFDQDNHTLLKISVSNDKLYNFSTTKNNFTYEDTMLNLVPDRIHPFLLFFNKQFVKWSDIYIIKDNKYLYFILNNHMSFTCTSLDIIFLPFNVNYTEIGDVSMTDTVLFKFNTDGLLSKTGTVVISTNDDRINFLEYESLGMMTDKTFLIDDKDKLSKSNFIVFRSNKLYSNVNIKVNSLNVVSIGDMYDNDRFLNHKLFYNTQSNKNKSNITLPYIDREYVKRIIKKDVPAKALDMYNLRDEFNFKHTRHLEYDANMANSMTYIHSYNQNLLDDVYLNRCNVITNSYTGAQIKGMVVGGSLRMLRLKYKEKNTFVMVYLNGEIYNRYNELIYDINSFTLPISGINDSDVMEFVYFKNINNTVIKTKITPTDNHIEDNPINTDDMIILCQANYKNTYSVIPNDKTLYNVPFSVDVNNNITLTDPYYYGKDLYLSTNNQFRYSHMVIPSATNILHLPLEFRTCLNSGNYLLFINHKLVNRGNYKLLIEDVNNPFVEPTVYSRINLRAGDIAEVFYTPLTAPKLGAVGSGVIVEERKVTITTSGVYSFKIPYPYTKYPDEPNNLFVVVGSVFVDPQRYIISGDYIIFDPDGIIASGRDITFIFVYDKIRSTGPTDLINFRNFITTDIVCVPATSDNQMVFTIPFIDGYRDIDFFIIKGSTFINPTRYDIATDKVVFNNAFDGVPIGGEVIFVFMHNRHLTSVSQSFNSVVADVNNQTTFKIVTPFYGHVELDDKMIVMVGSTFISKDRYTIDSTNKQLRFTDGTMIKKDRSISYLFFYEANDLNSAIAYVPESGYIYIDKHNLLYNLNKELYLLFVNGKKIDRANLIDVSNTTIRLKVDIKSRYDLCILNATSAIPEFASYINHFSKWDNIVNKLGITDLNTLLKIYIKISNTEPNVIPSLTDEAIINKIYTDFGYKLE